MTHNVNNIIFDSHNNIETRLETFLFQNKIPHLMFYGSHGSGKRTIINNFLNKLYDKVDSKERENYIMSVNCGYGKGIKFVREDIKFFSKTNISCRNGLFKTILLYNADKLTIDAQSALRRCIEQFSHSTRFIITAHDKQKILKPILSRFCSIFVQNPICKRTNNFINLHHIKLQDYSIQDKSKQTLKTIMNTITKCISYDDDNNVNVSTVKSDDILQISDKIYNKGFSGIDMIQYIEENKSINDISKYRILTYLNNHKKEFRCEKTFILFTIYCTLFRSIDSFHNLLFM